MEIRLVNDMEGKWGQKSTATRAGIPVIDVDGNATGPAVDIGRLIRKYWLLLAVLVILGATAGFVSVVMTSPMYRAHLLLESMNSSDPYLRSSSDGGSFEANEVNLQTQISILKTGQFLKRGADRVRAEVVPLTPPGKGLFSRLRQRFRPETQDPVAAFQRGIGVAAATFDARPQNKTRLIELSCESTSPEVAALFLNAMGTEFVEDSAQSLTASSQKTAQILSTQIEEAKAHLQDAEERRRNFVAASGNLFAGQDTGTLADLQLVQAKTKLAETQSQRIALQTKYEIAQRSEPETLPEVQNDALLRGYRNQLDTMRQEKASLLLTLTERNPKVQHLQVQMNEIQQSYDRRVRDIVSGIKKDYETALQEERHRMEDYQRKSGQVGAQADKASQYNALNREVETLRQMYQALLAQANQQRVSTAVPVNPMRVVEWSSAPALPYKPQPLLNISFGTMLGLALTGGLVFLRERMDRSIRTPGRTRGYLGAPELGVIPNLNQDAPRPAGLLESGSGSITGADDAGAALVAWQRSPAYIAESFRGTLASILRTQGAGGMHSAILVTSAGPGEGKTTVVQHLGMALAETGRRVLLIDADFRRPHLHRRFHLRNEPALIDMVMEDTPIADYPAERFGVPAGVPGLWVVPNRPTDSNVAKALYSPRLRTIFHKLRERYDMVLVDAPPILHLADTRIIAPLTDATILVVRSGKTDRESAGEAVRRMQEDGVFLLGTVLTDWSTSAAYRKRHYYYDYADEDRK